MGETNKADMAVVSRAVDVAIACAKGNANGLHGKTQVQAVDLEETAAAGAAVVVERAEGNRPAGRTAMAYVRALFGREHRRSTLLVMTMWVFTTLNYFGLATFLPQYYLRCAHATKPRVGRTERIAWHGVATLVEMGATEPLH